MAVFSPPSLEFFHADVSYGYSSFARNSLGGIALECGGHARVTRHLKRRACPAAVLSEYL